MLGGKIVIQCLITCRLCGVAQTYTYWSGGNSKQGTARAARRDGWSQAKAYGWICPQCAQTRRETRKKALKHYIVAVKLEEAPPAPMTEG